MHKNIHLGINAQNLKNVAVPLVALQHYSTRVPVGDYKYTGIENIEPT